MRRKWIVPDREDPRIPEPELPRFPLLLFLLAVIALAGLYHQLLIETLSEASAGPARDDAGSWVFRVLVAVGTFLGTRPELGFLIFLAIIAPGMIFYDRSRRYLVAVCLWSLILWAAAFTLAERPTKRAGEAIHQFLSMKRELPDPLPGSR